MQLSERPSQVTNKTGPDRPCVILMSSALVTSVKHKSQCLFMGVKYNKLLTVIGSLSFAINLA